MKRRGFLAMIAGAVAVRKLPVVAAKPYVPEPYIWNAGIAVTTRRVAYVGLGSGSLPVVKWRELNESAAHPRTAFVKL